MAIRPKTFTLNRDIYYRGARKKGDVVEGPALASLLARMPHLLDETKPPKTKPQQDEEVG